LRRQIGSSLILVLFCGAISGAHGVGLQESQAGSLELAEASRLSQQVVSLYAQKKYEEALPLASRVVEIRQKALGPDDPLLGDALSNLGAIFLGLHRIPESLKQYKRAIAILEKANSKEKLAAALHNEGWAYFSDGKLTEAEDAFEKSVAIRQERSVDTIEAADSLAGLGQLNEMVGKYKRSISFYQRALATREKLLGPDNKSVWDVARKCACVMSISNQRREAAELLKALSDRSHPAEAQREPGAPQSMGSVLQGKAIRRAEPSYPASARQAHIQGSVVVEVTVDEQGKVIKAVAQCGVYELRRASEDAARSWVFTPTLLSGVPVKVVGTIVFNYRL
jgi:TonB family protein